MASFEDIRYDNIYSNASYLFSLLHDQLTNSAAAAAAAGPSHVVVLNHVSNLNFINVYNNLVQYQDYIHRNNQKMITLVLSDEKIREWNNTINIIDDNIKEVYIFCYQFSNYLEMKRWNGCYKKEIRGVHLPDTLECKLLKLGIDYIHQILPEFRRERGIYRRLCTDAQDLLTALNNYFQNEIDSLDDDATEEISVV